MGEALGMIHPETQFLFICEPVKVKKQVLCSYNIVMEHA